MLKITHTIHSTKSSKFIKLEPKKIHRSIFRIFHKQTALLIPIKITLLFCEYDKTNTMYIITLDSLNVEFGMQYHQRSISTIFTNEWQKEFMIYAKVKVLPLVSLVIYWFSYYIVY